jgi:glycine cleavage system H protein
MKELNELILPEDVQYTADHEWARVRGDTLRVGVSDYAQDQLGDITFVELPGEGDGFEKGQEFGTLESVKAVAELYMPVGGEVLSVNRELEESPGLVNESPYSDGWMIEVRMKDPSELHDLMLMPQYQEMLKGLDR